MRALLIGVASSSPAVGISPWILPLIAVAAKLKENEAHGARRGRFLRFWSGARRNRSAKRTAERERRDRPVMHERFQAKLEATIWPD